MNIKLSLAKHWYEFLAEIGFVYPHLRLGYVAGSVLYRTGEESLQSSASTPPWNSSTHNCRSIFKRLSLIVLLFTPLVIAICITYAVDDLFNYDETVGRDYGPEEWNKVTCDDLTKCTGWPDDWLLGEGWGSKRTPVDTVLRVRIYVAGIISHPLISSGIELLLDTPTRTSVSMSIG